MNEWSPKDASAVSARVGRRVKVAGVILNMLLVAVTYRVGHLQFSEPEKYIRFATLHRPEEQRVVRRGNIYDRRGRLMATSVPLWSVFADPAQVESRLETARILSRVLDADLSYVYTRLLRTDRRFVWIKRQVSHSRAEWVRALDLRGVYLRKEYRRFYPYGELAGHVLGFTDIDGRGLEGIEARFNDQLAGVRDGSEEKNAMPRRGKDVYLSIDAFIQAFTRDALMKQVQRHEPEAAWAVVLDVDSGEVLSMVNWPKVDPIAPSAVPASHRRSRILNSTYEYGSVMKPITVAIALEEEIVEPETEIDCHNGRWHFGRRAIHDVSEHGTLTVSEIVAHSSNIGMAQIGLQVGIDRFWNGLRRFGFGRPTGIELPGESTGILREPAGWNDHSLISIAFGQEISTNAIALIQAYQALGNEGVLNQPTVVKKVVDPADGVEVFRTSNTRAGRRVVSRDTAREVMDMMKKVVEEGTGGRASLEHYTSAGKTGTGSLMCDEGRGYSKDKYISTFVGLAPASNPKIAVLVSLESPQRGGHYGGTVAGPAFREIARKALAYLNVPSDSKNDYIARAKKYDYR